MEFIETFDSMRFQGVTAFHEEWSQGMDFSDVFDAMKYDAARVSRESWPKGSYLTIQKGYPNGIPINENTSRATGLPEGTVCAIRPYMLICSPKNELEPWVPSQADLFAEDWFVL